MAVKLGEMLIKAGLITQDQLQEALEHQRGAGGKLGYNLIQMGLVKEEDITQLLSHQYGVASVNLRESEIDDSVGRIVATLKKTSRVVVAYEDNRSWGWGAEIAARIADECFELLDAPVTRVGALDTFVAYNPDLEDVILPQIEDLAEAARDAVRY